MKRIVSFLTAMVLVLSMIPAVSFAAEVRTVYLDPAAGADSNDGLTQTAPVKTVEAAYAALSGADEGVLVLQSTLTLSGETIFPTCDIPVTITGGTVSADDHIFFAGDTTLDNMTLTLATDSTTTYISSEGHDLTIGENVTCTNTGASRFCLTTCYAAGSNRDATLTVKSGNWRNIFAAGYKSDNTGNVTLIVTGGDLYNLLAPTFSGNLTGNTTMYVSGLQGGTVCVAPNETGAVNGNVDITLGDGVSGKVRVKRLLKNAAVNGVVTVTVDGDCSGLTGIAHEGSGTGTITETKLVLKSGVLDVTPCEFDDVSVEIPQGETLTLSSCDIAADTVNSAGTLVFSGAASLTADAITGSLNCTISGTPEEGHTYVTAPTGSTVTFPADSGVTETDGLWQTPGAFDESTFQGLVIRADKGVTVNLYSQYKVNTGTKQTPTHTVEDENRISYYYAGASGAYRCVASQSGYYKLTKNIYMSAQEAATCTEYIVQMDQRTGGTATDSWEVSGYQVYTDEMLALDAYNDDISQWPEYADVFTTPWFTETHAAQQQTTQEQAETFIEKLDDENDNMYVFSIGKSGGYEHDVWAVFFTQTDLSAAETYEEAAKLMGQDKPTVMYRAQIHGNEPAAGEAALAMLQRLDGTYGDGLIENINIVMLPRANPDGSQNFLRYLASGVDANRDMLRVKSQEITDYLKLYQLVEPEMVIDGHEYDGSAGSNYFYDTDITAGAGFTENNTEAYKELSIDLLQSVFETAEENGLTYRYYSNQLNSDNGNISRPYFGQQGCLSFLLETRGIGTGFVSFARRVVTQVISVETLLNYASDNTQAMQQLVDAEKQYIVDKGKTYREDDLVYLSTTAVSDQSYSLDLNRIYQNGSEATIAVAPGVFTGIDRTRIAPTAYVIPAGASFTDEVLALMDKQGIAYTYIPAGATVQLQQYTGTVTEAGLTADKAVVFGQGAYVFTMDQEKGITLSMLMEPDVTDLATQSGTLAQQGIITPVGGYFPIYRYCHDLNAQGFIDYTVSDVEVLHTTVYLDNTNGLDTNDGMTEATAVKTVEAAYGAMAAALTAGGEGSTGTLVVIGLYDLGTDMFEFPAAGFPVTVTGKTTEDGFSFKGGSELTQRFIQLHGDTTFRNIKLHSASPYTNNFIFANGHKLVMDEGINTTCTTGKMYYFTLLGGSYDYGEDVETADITVKSGTWRMIYTGGYRGSVTGTAKLNISDATVYAGIFAAYVGNVGKLEMNIADTAVTTGGIFAGTSTANTSHKIGTVQNGATVTLGENITATAVYCSARTYGSIVGGATVIADGVDLSAVPVYARYSGLSENYSTDWAVLKLNADVTQNVTLDGALPVDLNGHNITGSITVDGTLSVKDSQTDDYTVADGVYGKITGTVTGTLAAAEGYVSVDGQSFHRITQYVSGVSIRPSIAGVYYSGTWRMDEVLRSKVRSFGVAVSTVDMPDETFMTEDTDTLWTKFEPSALTSGKPITSAMISGILKAGASDNDARGRTEIYAATYLVLDDGTENGLLLVSNQEVACSLYDVMKLVDEYAYTPNADAVEEFYADWTDPMAGWGFVNIGKKESA